MKSNIYICKKNISVIDLVIGNKYIIEVFNNPNGMLTKSIITDYKDNKELISLFNLNIEYYFNTIEKVRESKLNILLNEI